MKPTRKDLVLRFLQTHGGEWINGTDIANEKVGGSEGLKRVRELRAEGHRIITRPHPDRQFDQFQYKLIKPESIAPVIQERLDQIAAQNGGVVPVQWHHDEPLPIPPAQSPGMAGRPFPLRMNKETGLVELTREVCVECGGMYDDDLEHRTTDANHLLWMKQEEKRTQGQTTIGLPEQPPPYKFTRMPDRLDMDTMAVCPRCRGFRRRGRKYFSRKKGDFVETPSEDFTRDPFKPTLKGEPNPCSRCGGFGIVPQFVQEGDLAVQSLRPDDAST